MSSLIVVLLGAAFVLADRVGATTTAGESAKSKFQADVYDELYIAHAQCDEELSQSRSEFIVETFERYRGNKVTRKLIRKLLVHNIRIARQELDETREERERFKETPPVRPEDGENGVTGIHSQGLERKGKLTLLDQRISAKEKYIEVNLCVLSVIGGSE